MILFVLLKKMNVKILCAVLSVIMLAGSCTSTQEPEGERVFTRFDFKETKMLDKVQEIVIDSLLYPASFRGDTPRPGKDYLKSYHL